MNSQCIKLFHHPIQKATVVTLSVIAATLLLSGCVTTPAGPNIIAMPGHGKSYEQFQYDDMVCRQQAQYKVGPHAQQAVKDKAVGTAVLGTVIGTAAGALIGGAGGRAGEGAAAGAGVGLLAGSALASNSAGQTRQGLQQQYNTIYTQCMYAKGNSVPVPRGYRDPQYPSYAPPPSYGAPPDYPPPDYIPPRRY